MTDHDTIDGINKLIRLGKGDSGRLEHIKDTLENNKKLYESDRKWIEYMINLFLNHDDKPRSIFESDNDDNANPPRAESDKNSDKKHKIYRGIYDDVDDDYTKQSRDDDASRAKPGEHPDKKHKTYSGIYDDSNNNTLQQNNDTPKDRFKDTDSEEMRILTSNNAYDVLGVLTNSDFSDIKKQWKTLSVRYNATRGGLTRSTHEQEKRTKIQIKINKAWEEIRGNQK